MAYIYQIINDINDKIYVGKTEFSIEKRFKEHCQDAFRKRNEKRPLYSAIRKYGIEHFHIELIEETDNPEEREIYWIEQKHSFKEGYNATLGGDGKNLYNHEEILLRLKEYPYPAKIAKEFNCSSDLIRLIAKNNNIKVKNSGEEELKKLKKEIQAFTKDGTLVAEFPSTVEAAKWCYENGLCSTLTSGNRAHISEVANGKRKTAYTYIWKYKN